MNKVLLLLLVLMVPLAFAENSAITINASIADEVITSETTVNVTVDDDASNATIENETEDNENGTVETEDSNDLSEDEDGTVENDDSNDSSLNESIEHETGIMQTPQGAEVRLLQLQDAIERAITKGSDIIAKIEQYNASANTTELETLLAQMEVLKTQVAAVNFSSETAVEEYVQLRHDANDLVKQFREAARALAKDRLEQIREEVKAKIEAKREEIKAKLEQARCRFNAERAKIVLDALNESDDTLVESLASCEADWSQVSADLRAAFDSLSEEQQVEISLSIKEDLADLKIKALAKLDKKIKEGFENEIERAKHRIEQINNSELREQAKKELERFKESQKERYEQRKEQIKQNQERLREARNGTSDDSNESDDESGNSSNRGED